MSLKRLCSKIRGKRKNCNFYLLRKTVLKIKLYHILTLAATTLSIVGCILFTQLPQILKLDQNTSITLLENETTKLKVDLVDINPGSDITYTINLYTNVDNGLNIFLSFDGEGNKGDLQKYVNVSFVSEVTSVTKSLSEVLNNGESFDMGKDIKKIDVSYSMPESIGNEAQNAYADFYINLNAKRV